MRENNISDLKIKEYTKESEVLRDLPELKQIFLILKECIDNPIYPILDMINDLRRIIQYHEINPDGCIKLITEKYPLYVSYELEQYIKYDEGESPDGYEEKKISDTIFILCVKEMSIFDSNSDFKTLLNAESFNKRLYEAACYLFEQALEKHKSKNDNQDTSTTEINNTTECSANIITLDRETEKKVLENFLFWSGLDKRKYKNIFKEIKQQTYTEMVQKADFSDLKQHGCSQRVQYNVYVLSKMLNNKEWGEIAAEKLGTTLADCQKRTEFTEHAKLKELFLQ